VEIQIETIEGGGLLEIRKQSYLQARFGSSRNRRSVRQSKHLGVHGRGKVLHRTFEVMSSQAELLQVILALHPSRCFAGCLNRGKEKSNENTNDGYNHQKLNQRKTTTYSKSHLNRSPKNESMGKVHTRIVLAFE
jgi:hypothetical protein